MLMTIGPGTRSSPITQSMSVFPTMKPSFALLLVLFMFFAGPLAAQIDLLLVPPADAEHTSPRPELTLYLNNPTEFDATLIFAAEIEAEYAGVAVHTRVAMLLVDEAQRQVTVPRMSRRTVKLRPAANLAGQGGYISLRLVSPSSNAIMFRPGPASVSTHPGATIAAVSGFNKDEPAPRVRRIGLGRRNLDLTSDIENMRRHISGYDPIYFAVGWRERFNARFQFSFKYRPIDPGPDEWEGDIWRTLAGKMHFAYTQTSIWDLESFSKPFYDSSYKPTIFALHQFKRRAGSPWSFSLQAGAQHESNGKGGGTAPTPSRPGLISTTGRTRHLSVTRSLNTLYALPRTRWEDERGRFFEAALRYSAYFQEDENPDIAKYRGYAELTIRGGYLRGMHLSAHLRGRNDGFGSVEFNLTWPTSEAFLFRSLPLVSNLGGYAQIQYFNGYGESLLDYDVRRKDQLRFGLMIVR
jgi:outer membrane phospholipase A